MKHLERADIVELYLKQSANITGLWGIYIAATFTGAAFSIRDFEIDSVALTFVTIGFWTFSLGHAGMLVHALKNAAKIAEKMSVEDCDILNTLGKSTSSITWSLLCHFIIDLCVTGLIWHSKI